MGRRTELHIKTAKTHFCSRGGGELQVLGHVRA